MLLGQGAERAARWSCVAALLFGAWHLGPPLPLLDVPGLSRCCGAAVHLAGLLLADTGMALAIEVVKTLQPHETPMTG